MVLNTIINLFVFIWTIYLGYNLYQGTPILNKWIDLTFIVLVIITGILKLRRYLQQKQ